MDLMEYRSQFDLHFLVPFSEDFQESKVHLRDKGHSVFHSTKVDQFFEEFRQSPSHLVIVDLSLIVGPIDDFLAECLDVASQTNFILIGSSFSRYKFWEYRDYGVLDYLSREDNIVGVLEWSVDNALERVVLKVLNKNLMNESDECKRQLEALKLNARDEIRTPALSEQAVRLATEGFIESSDEQMGRSESTEKQGEAAFAAGAISSQEEDVANLLTLYENTRNREDLLQVFFHSLEEYCDQDAKILYFKYLEPVQLLVATHGCGIPVEQIQGAGIRLNTDEVLEARNLLLSPRGFGSLNKLLRDVFHVDQCFVKPLLVREDIDGLFVFFGDNLEPFNTIRFNNRFSLFHVSFERFNFLKRQMELELEGILEHTLSYEEFYDILTDRLDQVQRHQLGLAMLRVSIDRLNYLEETYGPTAVNSVIRSLAVTGKKFTRSGDGFFRTAYNEFTLLVNHLKPQDATILAERVRLAMESLDIPPITGSVTVSLGISTYPQLATSAETLLKSSLQALTTVMGHGGNKVGVARVVRRPKVVRLAETLDDKG